MKFPILFLFMITSYAHAQVKVDKIDFMRASQDQKFSNDDFKKVKAEFLITNESTEVGDDDVVYKVLRGRVSLGSEGCVRHLCRYDYSAHGKNLLSLEAGIGFNGVNNIGTAGASVLTGAIPLTGKTAFIMNLANGDASFGGKNNSSGEAGDQILNEVEINVASLSLAHQVNLKNDNKLTGSLNFTSGNIHSLKLGDQRLIHNGPLVGVQVEGKILGAYASIERSYSPSVNPERAVKNDIPFQASLDGSSRKETEVVLRIPIGQRVSIFGEASIVNLDRNTLQDLEGEGMREVKIKAVQKSIGAGVRVSLQ